MTPDEAFKDWAQKRGVWPRLTHEEIFKSGWNAAIDAAIEYCQRNAHPPAPRGE